MCNVNSAVRVASVLIADCLMEKSLEVKGFFPRLSRFIPKREIVLANRHDQIAGLQSRSSFNPARLICGIIEYLTGSTDPVTCKLCNKI